VSAAERPTLAAVHKLPGGGRALFTERAHGNMASVGGEGAEHGASVRELIGVRRLARGHQVVRDVLACTICDERCFSHRRERAGRQAGSRG
jgi:hypothetical protein